MRTAITFALLAATLHAAGPELPPVFKNDNTATRQIDGDNWWRIFGDERLARLLERVASENLDVQAAMARVEQARGVAGIARSEFFPGITLNAAARRVRNSGTQLFPGFSDPLPAATINTIQLPIDFGYEIDLWGRVRRNYEAAGADANAARAARDALLLALRAETATTWFALRTLDTQRGILRATVGLRRESLALNRDRLKAGLGNDFDVARAEAEVAVAEADLWRLTQTRPALENALAVLTGSNPSTFTIPEDVAWAGITPVPVVPAGIPAELVSHRPDVAAAERSLAAAAARIGVARAAFLPTVKLGGQIGLLTSDGNRLFDSDSRTWTFGATISLPIFDGGRNAAALKAAKAITDEARANYERTVLAATADVETALGALRALRSRQEAQHRAETSTARGAGLARERYKAGTSPYLDVLEADRGALSARLESVALKGERLATTV